MFAYDFKLNLCCFLFPDDLLSQSVAMQKKTQNTHHTGDSFTIFFKSFQLKSTPPPPPRLLLLFSFQVLLSRVAASLLCVSLLPPRQETHRFSIDTVQRKCVRQFLGKQCSFRLCTVTLMRGFRLGGFLKPKLPTDGRQYLCFVCAACERSTSLVAVVVSYRLSLVLACLYSVATIPLRCFCRA